MLFEVHERAPAAAQRTPQRAAPARPNGPSAAPAVVDYLSVDTEGHEFEALRGFPFDRVRLRVVTVEQNKAKKEVDKLLHAAGMRLAGTIVTDDVWGDVDGAVAGQASAGDARVWAARSESRGGARVAASHEVARAQGVDRADRDPREGGAAVDRPWRVSETALVLTVNP